MLDEPVKVRFEGEIEISEDEIDDLLEEHGGSLHHVVSSAVWHTGTKVLALLDEDE